MISRSFSPDEQVTPIQVWPALSHDLRTGKEVSRADTTSAPKNPS